ncbi:hypothetical protein G4313_07510 [Coprococcus eutactus]|uniref:Uncharacterized protein n=1 Tax=Coprococcus ammoniilyticus TaxID=2981785 RepID=A0ABV1EN61_9FIRM|nr:hypothetical protein [Coprococcus eutactus]CCY60721.1 uncharacterized protein BN572_01802 [Clostridium sp. CAG:264]
MKFKSTNEIETIQLRDAQIKEMKLVGVGEVETDGEAAESVEKVKADDAAGSVRDAEASLKGLRARWLEFYVEGAVVKDNNSQNEYYTDKYADQMEIRFKNPVIEAVLLEGHKYYDANDNLVEEVPDQKLAEDEYEKIFGKFKENYIFYGGKPEADKKCYQMIVDVDEDSYIVSFYYDKVIAGWNHFLNKANMG